MAIVSWYGCHAQTNVPIKGKIQVNEDWKRKIYLVKPNRFNEIVADYLGAVIDSAEILPDGSFAFQKLQPPASRTLYILVVDSLGWKFPNHLLDQDPSFSNYMPIVLGPEESLDIEANADFFQTSFTLKSLSRENQSLIELRNIRAEGFEKYIETIESLGEDSLLIEKEKAFTEYIDNMISFADTTTSPEAAFVAIRWISPTNDYERIPEFIYSQCQQWSFLYPDNPFVKELCVAADKNKLPLMTGEILLDIPLPLVSGDTVNLFSLFGKKLTLVDIWASWCAPCRKESREELLPLWNQYRDKGFQIIGYSIDANEGSWKKAIIKDGSTWTHASHLTGDSTPFMDALRISTIPANYLLDADGKVLAKNLHGEQLRDFMEKYFR